MSIFRATKKFSSILSDHQKLRIVELAVLMFAGGLLEMCSVSLVLPFMNAVMEPEATMEKWYAKLVCELFGIEEPRSFLLFAAVLLAFVYILKNCYLLFQFNIQYRFVYGNMLSMQNRVLDNYIHRPYEFFLTASSGEIVRIVNTDIPNTFYLLTALLSIFTEVVASGLLAITIAHIATFITLCMAVALLVVLLLVNQVIKPRLHRAGIQLQESGAGMNKWLLQSVQGIKELKIMSKEEYFQENFDAHGRVYVESTRKNAILSVVPRFFIEAASMSTMFLIIAFLIYRGGNLVAIVPMLTAISMAAVRLLPSVNRISNGLANVAYYEPMLDKLIENLKEIEDTHGSSRGIVTDDGTGAEKSTTLQSVKNEVCFHEITFRYPDAESDVLSDASMTIRRGESVGVVGGSGAGKTTAVDILLGLLRPEKGQVLVDNIDISADMEGWHGQIGYIPQMIFMLDDTIRRNVSFGEKDEDISDERVWRALEDAALADFVRSLPKGLDTEIGERGVRLSGGQRQRIGIARALYRDPAVLVFDEATSALDNETEKEIMESIQHLQGQKTMIIIAHRLTTIEHCDHVYRVEHGKIQLER